ncbi:hypothetical protein Fmac_032600 [Flemingia macrophylla]|uniref:AAA+ ATPase domain-containing protein n=1 Tax=Flemingia macrophylla TaxID=520843 RepID=A0ABD1L5D8_9FABA
MDKVNRSETRNLSYAHLLPCQEYEIKLIEDLVDTVYKNIAPKHLHTGQNPIGLGARLEEVKSLLDMKPHDKTVSMLGIYGLRGIGKTELAKALYDEIVQEFDSACFLADVSEKSNKINGLEDLQKTLLSKMSGDLETRLSSTSKGMREIKRKLCQKKVLLVLDDVDDKDRLEKLAGGRDWFGLGSRIIITTSDKGVLIAHKVEKFYEMKELDQQLSLELFCWNVFKQSHPKIGFDNVSLRAVGFAKGLPSAIKVIASDLANLPEESLDDWECVLEEYERNPPNKRILDGLKINYDRLGCNAKQVFLDIACFFNGERIEYVKKILEEFGASNIDVLVNKSLLSIENDCLKMRDLIQDMGREIVRQETSKLGKRSRLWHYEDVIEVLTEDYGSDIDNIQGIMLDPPEQVKVTWDGTAFEKMKWLRILIIRNTLFSCEPKHLPNHLRVLEWEEYPSKSLPSKFHPKNIIIFNLPRAHLTLEAPFEDFSEFLFIQKVDARHTSLSTFTADMLWLQKNMKLQGARKKTNQAYDEATARNGGDGRNVVAMPAMTGTKQNNGGGSSDGIVGCQREKIVTWGSDLRSATISSSYNFSPVSSFFNLPTLLSSINLLFSSSNVKPHPRLSQAPASPPPQPHPHPRLSPQPIESPRIALPPPSRRLYLRIALASPSPLHCPWPRHCHRLALTLYVALALPSPPSSPRPRPPLASTSPSPSSHLRLASPSPLSPSLTTPPFARFSKSRAKAYSLSFLRRGGERKRKGEGGRKRKGERGRDKGGGLGKKRKKKGEGERKRKDAWEWRLKEEEEIGAAKGTRELEIVMPKTEIPEWFDFIGNGENPCFWVRGKFPTFSLALVFHGVAGSCERQGDHHQILQLQLVINGRCVSRSDYKFRIAADHVLICDLRILLSDEEWLGLDAFLLHDDYNVVQVSYQAPASLMLSQWGVHVSDEGANMEDVQFVCPNSKYLVVPTKEDPKEEPKELVENLGTDTASENIDYCENIKDSIGENMKALLYSVIGPSSDSEDIDPFLMAIFLTEYYASTPSLLEEMKDHQKEKRRKIFSDGIRDGLVQIQNNFPSLDIVKTRSIALMKGSKVRWISEEIPEVVKMYIGGIISGLSEAKLSFPNLDMDGTLSPMLHKIGMKGLNDRFGQPRLEVIEELNMDYGLQPLTRHIYHDGIMDGLYEAQKSFLSLDIVETKRVALSKMASHSKLYLGEDVAQVLPTDEIRIYTDGILGGLLEAKQSFPDLNIITTVTTVLCKMGIIEAYYVDHETEDFHQMNLALKRVKDKGKGLIMDVGEASSSNHQESDEKQGNNPQKEEVMREIFCEGITDGLVHAQNKFPSLDIDKTRIAALNKKIYDHKAVWSFPEPEDGHPPPSLEMKAYIEGIMNGLLEAKLSFPQLDIWATLDTLNSRRFKASIVSLPVVPVLDWTKVIPPPPGSHDNPLMQKSTIMKQQSSKSEAEENKSPQKLMEEHEALHNKFVQVENENVAPNKNSDIDNICEYDESIQKFNTQLEEFVSKKLDCTSGSRILTDKGCKCETKYEKASTLLKEWAEELGMLYDTGIEVFQNSEKFQDLMNVIYLNGLKDGLLEAETVLHAQDMNTKTQLSKENEEHKAFPETFGVGDIVISEKLKKYKMEIQSDENTNSSLRIIRKYKMEIQSDENTNSSLRIIWLQRINPNSTD